MALAVAADVDTGKELITINPEYFRPVEVDLLLSK